MCNCKKASSYLNHIQKSKKKDSEIINKWVLDKKGKVLLIKEPIYDIYNDIIGYITNDNEGREFRIFPSNIKQILD